MRIPMHKAYRAFSELDRFSDEDCQRFVAAARRHHRVSGALLYLLYIPAIAVILPLCIAMGAGLTILFGIEDKRSDDGAVMILWSVNIVAFASVLFVGALLIRDKWLRRILSDQLGGARCRICGYSLLGLPIVDDHVTCPECGKPFDLRETGLTPGDLLAVEDAPAPDASATPPRAPTPPTRPTRPIR